jgi:hypothetical protein
MPAFVGLMVVSPERTGAVMPGGKKRSERRNISKKYNDSHKATRQYRRGDSVDR